MSSTPKRLPFEPKKKQKANQKKSDVESNTATKTAPTKTPESLARKILLARVVVRERMKFPKWLVIA